MQEGLLYFPNIHNDQIVFVSEDDLWLYQLGSDFAFRLTAGKSPHASPHFSPDGSMIAYTSSDDGPAEVYCIGIQEGEPARLTYQGYWAYVRGWTPEGEILFSSSAERPFYSDEWLWVVEADGGLPRRIPWGPALMLSFGPEGEMVLGRNTKDPSAWKRYRGGTAGELWVSSTPSDAGRFDDCGAFVRLKTPDGNVTTAHWVGERIFFVSDHEGIANVYSLTPQGEDLRRHTDHEDFYARHLRSDGKRLVYTCGGELYLLDPTEHDPTKLNIKLASGRSHSSKKYFSVDDLGIETFSYNKQATHLGLVSRGKAFVFANWDGPVVQLGKAEGVRYRLLGWLNDDRCIAFACDERAEHYAVLFSEDDTAGQEIHLDFGTVENWWESPTSDLLAFTNHRHQVLLVDLGAEEPELIELDVSEHGGTHWAAWSSDGRWLAYDFMETSTCRRIKVCRIEDRHTFPASQPVLQDYFPSFDPAGKYLYFIGQRSLEPTHDDAEFNLSFRATRKLYAVALTPDVPSPFKPEAKPLESEAVKARKRADSELSEEVKQTEIVEEGLLERVMEFPLDAARYGIVYGAHNGVVYLDRENGQEGVIDRFNFETQSVERIFNYWSDTFALTDNRRTMVVMSRNKLRVLPVEVFEDYDNGYNRASGKIDLSRVKIPVREKAEFVQMFRDAWRLQRDHFWDAEMAGIDWDELYERYLPMVKKVRTRQEFTDVLYELLGELGTSHAYIQPAPDPDAVYYRQGFLGADWEWTGEGYRCRSILGGDSWDEEASSPLAQPGLEVEVGDILVAINGQPLSQSTPPGALLMNHGGLEVELTLEGPSRRHIAVKTLYTEKKVRYRDWINSKRSQVHQETEGRVGYIHIPDMDVDGFAEFHRGFLNECDREALIVDVRFNGGGNVSSLLLQKLLRRRLGYNFPRWGSPVPYPMNSPRGPLVAITNEHAGSDGDIFSHAFKQLGLGPLVGRRTWGGVIGISPRYKLADGTVTTQPEFSFFFDDIGWDLENRGTTPDIEVDISPAEYFLGQDPQLDKAVEVILKRLEEKPAHSPTLLQPPRTGKIKLPPRKGAETAD